MPTVPKYGQPQVSTRPLPTVRMTAVETPESLGAGIGELGTRISLDQLHRITDKHRREADQIAVNAFENQVYDANRKLSEKVKKTTGKDALGLIDTVPVEFDDAIGEFEKGLSTDRQREAAREVAQRFRFNLLDNVTRHMDAEREAYDTQEGQARVANGVQAAITADHPYKRSQELYLLKASIEDFHERRGFEPDSETTKSAVLRAESAVHVGVLEGMIASTQSVLVDVQGKVQMLGPAEAAKAYYAEHQDQITADKHASLETRLDNFTTEQTAMTGARSIWRDLGPKSDTDKPNMVAMEEAAATMFAKDRQGYLMTMQLLHEREGLVTKAQTQKKSEQEDAVWQAYDAGATIEAVTRMPEWQHIDGSRQHTIRKYIADQKSAAEEKALAKRRQAEDDAWTRAQRDPAKWDAFYRYSTPESLSQMSEADIRNLTPELGLPLRNALMEARRDYAKNADAVRSATMDRAVFNDIADEAKLNPYDPKKTEEQASRLGSLYAETLSAISLEQQATGKQLTLERKKEIAQGLLDRTLMVHRPGWFGFGGSSEEMAAVVVNAEEKEKAWVPIDRISASAMAKWVNEIRVLHSYTQHFSAEQIQKDFHDRIQRAHAAAMLGLTKAEQHDRLNGK